jgi:hypothetical protein
MLIASFLIALAPVSGTIQLDTGTIVLSGQIDKVVNRYCELSPTNTAIELQQKVRPGIDSILEVSRMTNRALAEQGNITLKEETRRYVSDTVQVGGIMRSRAAKKCPES